MLDCSERYLGSKALGGVLHWFWLTTWMECIVVVPDFQVKLLFVPVQFGSNLTLLDGIEGQ
jgi:hypothetical protein